MTSPTSHLPCRRMRRSRSTARLLNFPSHRLQKMVSFHTITIVFTSLTLLEQQFYYLQPSLIIDHADGSKHWLSLHWQAFFIYSSEYHVDINANSCRIIHELGCHPVNYYPTSRYIRVGQGKLDKFIYARCFGSRTRQTVRLVIVLRHIPSPTLLGLPP